MVVCPIFFDWGLKSPLPKPKVVQLVALFRIVSASSSKFRIWCGEPIGSLTYHGNMSSGLTIPVIQKDEFWLVSFVMLAFPQ